MTEIERLLKDDARDKKRNGRGDYNKKRQGGRHVHFRSDYMSRKEWNKMNGEVMSYDLGKLMTWDEFKKLPDDLAKEYILRIRKNFDNVPQTEIAKAFDIAPLSFRRAMQAKNIDGIFKVGGHPAANFYKSRAWIDFENWKAGKISMKDLGNVENDKVVDDAAPEEPVKEEPASVDVTTTNAESFVADENTTFLPKYEHTQSEITGTISTTVSAMTLEDIVKTLRALGVNAEINIRIEV